MRARTVPIQSAVDALCAALGFLTVILVPERRAERGRGAATVLFPWVGVALGGVAAVIMRVPIDRTVASALALAVILVVTGGLHWDGWADVLDATLTPGLTRARRVEILSDSRLGANGAIGVTLLAVMAVRSLSVTPAWGVLLGSSLGRWVMVASLRWSAPLAKTGAAATLRAGARPVASGVALATVVVLVSWMGAPAMSLALACGVALGVAASATYLLVARLGGMNGDAHGAVGLLTEVTVWVVAAATGNGA